MLDWRTPLISDLDVIKTVAEVNHQFGNEMSAVNLFLYRNKYDTKIAFFDEKAPKTMFSGLICGSPNRA